MRNQGHLTCFLRKFYAVQKQQLEPAMKQQTGSKLEKEYDKDVYCHSTVKCQAGWSSSCNQICQETWQQLQIWRWYHSNGRKWRGTKGALNEVKEESEKPGLKLNIKQTKIMASSPNTSWQIEGEKLETVTHFIFLSSKITVEGNYSKILKNACFLKGEVWQT